MKQMLERKVVQKLIVYSIYSVYSKYLKKTTNLCNLQFTKKRVKFF